MPGKGLICVGLKDNYKLGCLCEMIDLPVFINCSGEISAMPLTCLPFARAKKLKEKFN